MHSIGCPIFHPYDESVPLDRLNPRSFGSRTAYEFARGSIREAIIGGVLVAGERLVQTELAEALQVSTTPVREALRDLATEGLITLDPHKGAIVRSLKIEEVWEIYQLREVLEPIAIRRAIEEQTADVVGAADILMQMEDEQSMESWVELNRRFHAALTHRGGHDSKLVEILEGLRSSAAPFVALSIGFGDELIASSHSEHHDLLKASLNGDADWAIEATLTHLRSTMAVIEQTARSKT